MSNLNLMASKYGQRVRIPTVGGGLAPAFAQAAGRVGDCEPAGLQPEGLRDRSEAVRGYPEGVSHHGQMGKVSSDRIDLALVHHGVHGAAGEHAYEGEAHSEAVVGVHAIDGVHATVGRQALERGSKTQMPFVRTSAIPSRTWC